MKIKKMLSIVAVGVLCMRVLTACGGKASQKNAISHEKSGSASVSMDGSTSMEKVIGILGESFQKETGITFTYNPTGSGSGIKAVSEGRCDIGLASRNLKDEEKASGLTETVIAHDGIAMIVNPDNPIRNVSITDIVGIYTGKITNWSQVGGKDEKIVVIGREAGSGTRDGFESITKTKNACKYRQELTSTGDVITTVAQNPNAIGYASAASIKNSVKALTVDGVAVNEKNIQNGRYTIQRPFVLVTKKAVKLSDAAKKFFDYATSRTSNDLISKAGVVPAN
ncbi:phosphate ABC transporter phosphate-binding protein [Megasphaera hutchinsoni]|uniref:Phosphate-binding protein n=1 Tax=Megasphaera hutchinsoni TaxID=1588748 RepID=A0A2J8BA26_9FIRM|nr:phosphate ABC transporter substrate-binding protein [Megasphaera genomosp. type_2]PNH21634.1 phosphate ABC transporter phosphate-binding protein [Megasphaera genomosp. type_2]